MYHDPKHIKDKRHTVRLNDDQDAMVMAASRMFGYHPASVSYTHLTLPTTPYV